MDHIRVADITQTEIETAANEMKINANVLLIQHVCNYKKIYIEIQNLKIYV